VVIKQCLTIFTQILLSWTLLTADCPLTDAKIKLTEQESYLESAENDLILWLQDPMQENTHSAQTNYKKIQITKAINTELLKTSRFFK